MKFFNYQNLTLLKRRFIYNLSDVQLLKNLFRMNIRDRYLGSRFGSIWAVLTPLLLMLVYTFVFGVVFQARAPGAETSAEYVIWLISGLGIWFGMNEGIMNGTNSMVASAGLIKNLTFRTELLPVAAACTGIMPILVSAVLLVVLMLGSGTVPTWHVVLVPFVALLALGLAAAIGMFTSVINVFSRDFGHGLPTFLLMTLFFTPIFYSVEALPAVVQKVTSLNPFHHVVDSYRKVLIEGSLPNFSGIAYLIGLIAMLYVLGGLFFVKMKSHCVSRL